MGSQRNRAFYHCRNLSGQSATKPRVQITGGRSYRREDDYDDDGGYGHDAVGALSSYGEECCPLVVDSTALFTLIFSIAGAAFFLSRVAMISLGGRRKRKRRRSAADRPTGCTMVYPLIAW